MTTINLLPWREARRKEQQQDFIVMLAVAAVLAILVVAAGNMVVGSWVSNQQERNRYVERELAQLDQQIKEINELETRRAELVSRMSVIQDLQNNRPSIVYVFDQLVRTVPDGVFYTEISKLGNIFTISGMADSNNRISTLMRNLNSSPWFRDPDLKSVTAISEERNQFSLVVSQDSQATQTVASEGQQ